jgi:methionyl-tRNA formyltransferase
LSHAILENSPTFGVTLHWARAEVDTGDIIKLQLFKIPRNITAKELHSLVVECGTEVGLDFIANARVRLDATETNIKGKPCRLFARNSLDQYREITDLTDTEEVSRRSRACHFPPFPPAFIVIDGRNIQLVPSATEDFQSAKHLYEKLKI